MAAYGRKSAYFVLYSTVISGASRHNHPYRYADNVCLLENAECNSKAILEISQQAVIKPLRSAIRAHYEPG
ncbi:unnamed protein product [Fusarium graminearum]|nr:unnamed protein product [Fusarium graminearum]